MKKSLFYSLAAATLLATSCRRGTPSWDTGLVFPIAHASLSIDNIVADSLINQNSDGSIKLVYTNTFPGLSSDTLLNFPDTTIKNIYSLPPSTSTTFFPGDAINPVTPSNTTLASGVAQITFGIISEGRIILDMQNDIRRRVVIRYQIPLATKNNIAFDTSFTVPAAADSLHGHHETAIINLSGYNIDFTGANHDRVNTIETIFSAKIDPTETQSTVVYSSDTVAALTTISGISPYYIRGYFGNSTYRNGPNENNFSFFSKVRSGSLGLDSLKMSLSFSNYVGMDARLTVNNIWSRNTRTGQSVYLSNAVIGSPINVNRAVNSTGNPPPLPSTYNFTFDNSNSNAKNLIENLPDKFGYDFTVITNPLGNVSGSNDFLFANYGIDATLNVEMPLNFFADRLVVEDTVTTNFGSVKNKENILDGTITLYAQNGFPFSAAIQLYLLDAGGNVTDSIVTQPNSIQSAPLMNINGYLASYSTSNSVIRIPLDHQKTQQLLNSSRIIMKAEFDTHSTPQYVKIFSSDKLDLNLTADFNYRVGD